MVNDPRLRFALTTYAGALLLIVTLHFIATAVSLQPANPLKDRLFPVVSSYMAPYFIQNWRLFAPEPLEPTKHVWISCRMPRDKQVVESELQDVTVGHYQMLQTFRLSPAQRLLRAQMYALTMVQPPPDKFVEALENFQNHKEEPLRRMGRTIVESRAHTKQDGMETMARVASAECKRLYPGDAISAVQVFYTHESAPPYSERNRPDAQGKSVQADYGWLPFHDVAIY